MKDAECAETNEKPIFRFFLFFIIEIWLFLYSKLVNFSMNFKYKIDHNSENKNWKLIFHLFQLIHNY